MSDYLADYQRIENLAILRALGNQADLVTAGIVSPEEWQLIRRDKMRKVVPLIVNADLLNPLSSNSYTLRNIEYIYDQFSTAVAAEPAIIEPTDSVGRYFMVNNPIILSDAVPSAAPDLPNSLYVAELATPNRVVTWRSPQNLIETPTINDWAGETRPIEVDIASPGLPTFNADFIGQKVKNINAGSNTNVVFEALDQAGTWQASFSDNGYFVPGEDIAASFTIDASIGGKQRNITATSTVTLPAGLPNIRFQIAVFDAIAGGAVTLDLDINATTLNGTAGSITGLANRIVTIYNFDDEWYAI